MSYILFQMKSGTVAHLKAVAKVNVQQLARVAVQHEVGRVAVPQPQQVPHHAHHSCAASVPRSSLQPHLAVAALQPQHLMQVLACNSSCSEVPQNERSHIQGGF